MAESTVEARGIMHLRKKLLIITVLVGFGITAGVSPVAADPEVGASTSGSCEGLAVDLLEQNGFTVEDGEVTYTCAPGTVGVSQTHQDGTEVAFVEEVDGASSSAARDTAALAAVNCDAVNPPTRTIVSELQVDLYLCAVYGQVNSPEFGSWTRSIQIDWTVYPGWNSAQSRISTIPSEGSPTLTGTVTSQKQNGVLPPTELSSAAFTMQGNDSATGYVVGGLNTDGSHSVKMEDLYVTDADYAFDQAIEGSGQDVTPRFSCDSSANRCFYPNGEEAGL